MNTLTAHDSPTPLPLIEELAIAGSPAGWERFVFLYDPFLRSRLARNGLQDCDERDLIQEIYAIVCRRLPDFRHNGRTGAFRCWLREITIRVLQNYFRGKKRHPILQNSDWVDQLADSSSSQSAEWDREHDFVVAERLLELVRAEFETSTYEAFHRTVLGEEDAGEVAESLNITVNAVYIARSRVLARLRTIGRGLLPNE